MKPLKEKKFPKSSEMEMKGQKIEKDRFMMDLNKLFFMNVKKKLV
jgi:hypothetical protein